MLQRLSIFAGGWTLAAAEQICAGDSVEDREVFDLLTSLCNKSLVVVEQNDGNSRYRLLETVRQYARERLLERGGDETIRDRHRHYFLALAEEAAPELKGSEEAVWLRRLDAEHENLRTALEWSFSEMDPAAGLLLCGALAGFWRTRGHLVEGREWCARILVKPGAEERTTKRARVLNVAGTLAYFQADYPASRADHEESLAIMQELGDLGGIAFALGCLGAVAFEEADYAAARALQERSLSITRQLGNQSGTAYALNNLGNVALSQGDLAAAQALYKECLAIARELGDRGLIAIALGALGNVALEQGDLVSSRALYEQSLEIDRELDNRFGISVALGNLGEVAVFQRDYHAAAALHQMSLTITRELGHRQSIASSLCYLGDVACERGDYRAAEALHRDSLVIRRELNDKVGIARSLEGLAALVAARGSVLSAARIWGAAARLREEVRSPLQATEQTRYDRRVSAARDALSDDLAFEYAWQEGRVLTLDRAIERALEATVKRH